MISPFFIQDNIEFLNIDQNKNLKISKLLHEYVISEIIKHNIATKSQVIEYFKINYN